MTVETSCVELVDKLHDVRGAALEGHAARFSDLAHRLIVLCARLTAVAEYGGRSSEGDATVMSGEIRDALRDFHDDEG